MLFGGLVGLLQLALVFLVVVVIVFAVMLFGGLLVAAVSLPALWLLPAVRRQFVGFTGRAWGTEVESLTECRFVTVYVFLVETVGVALVLSGAATAEFLGSSGRPVPGQYVALAGLAVAALFGVVGVGLVSAVRGEVTRAQLRVAGEWAAFLAYYAGLVVVAFFTVPWLVFALGSLRW
jgi:hypothetical protein